VQPFLRTGDLNRVMGLIDAINGMADKIESAIAPSAPPAPAVAPTPPTPAPPAPAMSHAPPFTGTGFKAPPRMPPEEVQAQATKLFKDAQKKMMHLKRAGEDTTAVQQWLRHAGAAFSAGRFQTIVDMPPF